MTHPRQEIRAAAVAAVTGLTTTGSNVYTSQVYPMEDSNLPALRVYTRSDARGAEGREYVTVGAGWGGYARSVELVIEAVVKTTTTYDNTLDTICEEVETALESKSAWTGVSGEVVGVHYQETQIELSDEAEVRQAMATIRYSVSYYPSS
jgi:hypothetical protein